MAFADTLRDTITALLGVSAYQPPGKGYGLQIDDPTVTRVREAMGGNIQPLPSTRLRWYLKDLEVAQYAADAGYIRPAAQLYRAMRRDGVLAGLLGSRMAGLIRLPKRFYGPQEISTILRSKNGSRSVFDEMCPSSELGLLATDGLLLGIGIAELVPVKGRSYPVLVRLEPEFLQYRWAENRWYFNSMAGALPIVPGDGRWVLHIPGNRLNPWTTGLWPALGRSFINKEHAMNHRSNYSAKLANPARVAVSPAGANEDQRATFFRRLMAWGVNTVFNLPVGWDVKLIESNGRGFDVFQREIDTSDMEYMVAIAGQLVTTTGGTGFANAEVPAAIRHDLIQADADAVAYTVNTQILPQFVVSHFGPEALANSTLVEWDTSTPTDRMREATILQTIGPAIQGLTTALRENEADVDVNELAVRYNIPLLNAPKPASEVEPEEPEDGGEGGEDAQGDETGEKTPSKKTPKGATKVAVEVTSGGESSEKASATAPERPGAIIRKRGNKYILYTHDGKKRLGTHDSREDAERQERVIEMHKHEK